MMNIEKFIDAFGDDVYALALVCTKNFDSAAEIFSRIAAQCGDIPENAEMIDIARMEYPLCQNAKCTDTAETLSQIGLSKKQEALLAGFFPRPMTVRAAVHLYFENDLTIEQTAELLGEKPRYIMDQMNALGDDIFYELESSYKEVCAKISAPDELKAASVQAAKSGEKRLFEVVEDPVPLHVWTKKQKTAAVIVSIFVTIALMIVIPIVNKLIDDWFAGGSYDDTPSDMIFSYNSEAEQQPEETAQPSE